MQVGDAIHGFTVKSVQYLPEVNARLWRFHYTHNGADLVWMDRAEDNATFAICFKTLPGDDTGVAHVLEHSVLCGSEKYPSKEPFVDLLKGSLATFLNALTYPDKTVYPVSSRNARDFLNLMDVYLDAVLHPLSLQDPHALAQEGWHYEIDKPDGPLSRNGVVYSEMKGVFANPDSVVFRQTMHALFPSNCYGCESGGDPASIPDLTFEKYRAFHARFYHPSNARIFLDGQLDLDAVLAKIDSFLAPYDRISPNAEIAFQPPVATNAVMPYEIGPDEDSAGKTLLACGWAFGTWKDRDRQLAFTVLADVLAGSNEAPLKKQFLDAGLCEDLELGAETLQQPLALLLLRNVPDGKADAARKLLRETLEKLAREGLDRRQLAAALDHAEFVVREKDSGATPRGLAFMEAAYESWLYGGDPADAFRFSALFARLRAAIENGGFERYLREIFLDNPHRSEIVFTPSRTLGAERRAAEERALAAIKASWSQEEIAAHIRVCAELKQRQKRPDKPEDLAKLPRLALRDLPRRGPEIVVDESVRDGVCVLRSKAGADGIVYLQFHFPLAGLDAEDLSATPFFAALLGDLPTARRGALALKADLDSTLGRFETATRATKKGPWLSVSVAALDAKKDEIGRLLGEVFFETRFDDAKLVGDMLKQTRQDFERGVVSAGHRYAMRRAGASFSAQNRLEETLDGIDQLRWLQRADDAFAKDPAPLLKRLDALKRKIFRRDGLVAATSDNVPEAWTRRLAATDLGGSCTSHEAAAPLQPRATNHEPRATSHAPRATSHEAFVIPGDVGFAGVAGLLGENEFDGSAVVAARILSLDWLWNQIRVLGGAYGMGCVARVDGDVQYMTYRDPNPKRSFEKIAACGRELAAFAKGDKDLDPYVVSALGKTEPYLTPRLVVNQASELYFAERTPEDVQRLRGEILDCDKRKLAAFAKRLDELRTGEGRCLVGGKAVVDACSNLFDRVENVVR